jgi:hypothetical protein
MQTRGDNLDREYIERWARELDVFDLWRSLAGEETSSDDEGRIE